MYLTAWNNVSHLEMSPSPTKGENMILNEYTVNGSDFFVEVKYPIANYTNGMIEISNSVHQMY